MPRFVSVSGLTLGYNAVYGAEVFADHVYGVFMGGINSVFILAI